MKSAIKKMQWNNENVITNTMKHLQMNKIPALNDL